MIKAIIFDIDNTLYSYDDAHAVAWKSLCDYVAEHLNMDAEYFAAEFKKSIGICNTRLGINCGSTHNRMLRFQDILERHKLPLRHAWHMNDLYWNKLIAAAKPEPGIVTCLQNFKAAGYILGIGTDMTSDFQLLKLEKLGLIDYFDFLVSSEEVNIEKPDGKLFACCIEKANVPAEECLFIGDSLRKDYQGALNAGMQALWYCPDPAAAQAHPQIRKICNFDELRQMFL